MKTKKKTKSCTIAHKLDCHQEFISVSADDSFSCLIFLCYTLGKEANMQKSFFQSYSTGNSLLLSGCFIAGHLCACVSRKKRTTEVEVVNHECTDVCTLCVIQLTE